MAKKFYVVWQGRVPGIYTDWTSCKQQVDKFAGAKYKSFPSREEAESAWGKKAPSYTRAGSRKVAAQTVKTSRGSLTAQQVAEMAVDIKIFTDGGCDPNPGKAGSGIALYENNQLSALWFGLFHPHGTNNTAELNALHQALLLATHYLNLGKKTAIFCDSSYSIQCITQWAVSWQKNGWTRSGGEIKNLDLIQPMFALYQTLKADLRIYHVNGHVGIEGNELADRMSILAVDRQEEAFSRYDQPLDIPTILALRAG